MNRCVASVLTASLFLAAVSCAFAQGITGKGIKAGLSLASLDVDRDFLDDWETKVGFAAGGFVTITLAPNIALQPEILYVEKGGQQEISATDEQGNLLGTDDVRIELNYIEIPVLARVSLPTSGKFVPSLLFGPALAIKLSSKLDAPVDTLLIDEDRQEEDLDWIRSTDFVLIVGAGFDLNLQATRITFDVRYNLGLLNLNDSDTSDIVEYKNRSISLLAGVGF